MSMSSIQFLLSYKLGAVVDTLRGVIVTMKCHCEQATTAHASNEALYTVQYDIHIARHNRCAFVTEKKIGRRKLNDEFKKKVERHYIAVDLRFLGRLKNFACKNNDRISFFFLTTKWKMEIPLFR